MKPVLVTVALLAAAVAGVATAATPRAPGAPAALRTGAPRQTVLAVQSADGRATLSRRDAVTLAPAGRRLALRSAPEVWARSPGGRYLAVADSRDGLAVVDLRTMRVTWRLPRGVLVRALAWEGPGRLLLVEHAAVLVADPVARRVVGRIDYQGEALQVERAGDTLVILASAGDGRIGPARLVVVGPGLSARTLALPEVLAGVDGGEGNTGPFRGAWPALAVDPAAGRAYVAGGEWVAAVDLRSLVYSLAQPERTPQKVAAGPVRSIAWLGSVLVIAGYDLAVAAGSTSGDAIDGTAYGLRYLRDGRTVLVDRDATQVRAAGGLALAYGSRWWDASAAGSGLAAYDAFGALRWRALPDTAVDIVAVAGRAAYVRSAGSLAVVEIATGRILSRPSVPRGLWILDG